MNSGTSPVPLPRGLYSVPLIEGMRYNPACPVENIDEEKLVESGALSGVHFTTADGGFIFYSLDPTVGMLSRMDVTKDSIERYFLHSAPRALIVYAHAHDVNSRMCRTDLSTQLFFTEANEPDRLDPTPNPEGPVALPEPQLHYEGKVLPSLGFSRPFNGSSEEIPVYVRDVLTDVVKHYFSGVPRQKSR